MKSKLLLLAMLPFVTHNCIASSLTAAVTFGSKVLSGVRCSGKGMCSVGAMEAASSGAVKVNFEANPESDTLVLTFSLGELADNQINQVAYFTNPSKTYFFDNVCSLTDPVYAPLGLMPNAKILPSSPATFKINGDVVKLSIKYAHNSFMTSALTFGTKPYTGGGFTGRGIYKATSKNVPSPEAIMVGFMTNPDNDTLLMTFSLNDLIHKQVRQVANFADTLKTYAFDNVYSLAEPLYTSLNLNPNAKILPASPTVVKIVGDTVKLYVKYAHNSTLLASVTFGARQASGGPGKGVANIITNDVPLPADAVRVNFQASPDNDTLTMVFSLYEMMNRQLHQVTYFTNPSGTYSFDDEYLLTSAIYAPLNLPPNAKISRKSPSALTINGDQVKLSIAYAHD